jgi:hypothetical protein
VPEPSDYWVEFRDRLHELGDEPVLIGAEWDVTDRWVEAPAAER